MLRKTDAYRTCCPEAMPHRRTVMAKHVTTAQPWSTSRTPTPLPRKSRHPHYVFGDFLYNCRLLADALGMLASFFCKKKEP
jgi:hypothetical protein